MAGRTSAEIYKYLTMSAATYLSMQRKTGTQKTASTVAVMVKITHTPPMDRAIVCLFGLFMEFGGLSWYPWTWFRSLMCGRSTKRSRITGSSWCAPAPPARRSPPRPRFASPLPRSLGRHRRHILAASICTTIIIIRSNPPQRPNDPPACRPPRYRKP